MAALRFPTKLLINGQCLAGDGRAEAIINPANGEVLCEVREASADQRRQAVDAASAAFPAWAALTPKDRSGFLLKIADAIETHGDELAMLESLNCGKPLTAARQDEILGWESHHMPKAGQLLALGGTRGSSKWTSPFF